MKSLEKNIQSNDFELNNDIKDLIILLFENFNELEKDMDNIINILVEIIKNIEPTYNYILQDLSSKHKNQYLELSDKELIDEDNPFSKLLTINNDKKIPDDINIIFLNYIMIINMLKKELHYMIITCRSTMNILRNQFKTIKSLTNGLNIVIVPKNITFF